MAQLRPCLIQKSKVEPQFCDKLAILGRKYRTFGLSTHLWLSADGFYEWKRTATSQQPFCFEVNDGELSAFAGLWDGWRDSRGQWIKTCSILTTTPNAVAATVHDRMPVILHPHSYDLWLDPGITDVQVVSELLKPYDPHSMRLYPVSTRVNHVENDDEECSRLVKLV